MKAKLLKDQVSYGSGLEDWDKMRSNAKTDLSRKFIDNLQNQKWSEKERASLRRNSIPAQKVDVLEIFDQARAAQYYATPTPSMMVALIRGKNFDGQTVETVVSLSYLLFEDGNQYIPLDEFASARGLVASALEWDEIRKLFGEK